MECSPPSRYRSGQTRRPRWRDPRKKRCQLASPPLLPTTPPSRPSSFASITGPSSPIKASAVPSGLKSKINFTCLRSVKKLKRKNWRVVGRRCCHYVGRFCVIRSYSATSAASPSQPAATTNMGSTLDAAAPGPFKVLVIGGSYGGLAAALNLSDLCLGKPARGDLRERNEENANKNDPEPFDVDITMVDERDGFYHVIGSPLVFASSTYAEKAWIPYKDIPALQTTPNIRPPVRGSVVRVDLESKTAEIRPASGNSKPHTLAYDILVVAAGLRRAFPVVPQALERATYLSEVAPHIQAVTHAPDGVLVVGGGAVGVEMAAELKLAQPQTKVTLAHSRARLLSSEPLPDTVASQALALLQKGGVDVLLDHRLETTRLLSNDGDGNGNGNSSGDTPVHEVTFTNGHTLRTNAVVRAMSQSVPSTQFLPPAALDAAGYLRIRPNLFFPADVPHADSALGVGDLVAWSGIKRCGGAMHHGALAAWNVHQRMRQLRHGTAPVFQALEKTPPMIALALGKEALAFGGEDGVKTGTDIAEHFFQDDVGLNSEKPKGGDMDKI
ncbi:Pyridine nucleotide-disulfide oxidoreductase, NAD-binding domain protein [Niveomyces insectorum RCEF 264]|uniref:Pyridine nucleotide-disulfide oxidoreductase, NAD-binding domain protein n=1 Tax=Niveomyces insectorum RCEF 264 TaxID=1081102 RepID=A0A168A020_9HYPO|nr:Pyridine nucleotide-disulfide oxidoreductase, NAD-binding domain protein [Niveomyces insectorum RCEF 264]